MREQFCRIYGEVLARGWGAKTGVSIAMQQCLWELFCITQGSSVTYVEDTDAYLRDMMKLIADRFLNFGDGKILKAVDAVKEEDKVRLDKVWDEGER